MPVNDVMPRPFDVSNAASKGTIWEEWAPHARMSENSFEWWYLTTYVHDAQGNPYFLFLSVSGFVGDNLQKGLTGQVLPEDMCVIGLPATITDYNSGKVRTPNALAVHPVAEYWNPDECRITADDGDGSSLDWQFDGDVMRLKYNNKDSHWDFTLTNCSDALWHKDKHDTEGVIQQGGEEDRSFYYSLTNCNLSGKLVLKNDDGSVEKSLDVHGRGWVDRQYGDFACLFWEWTSFRFNNGATLHLYNFFNGHQEGLYRDENGNVQYFSDVIVKQNGYAKSKVTNTWASWGWTYEFPIEIEGSKHYTVVPKSNKEFMEFPTLNVPSHVGMIEGYGLYEGVGDLINDETGEIVGVTVNESGDARVMENTPFAKNQR